VMSSELQETRISLTTFSAIIKRIMSDFLKEKCAKAF